VVLEEGFFEPWHVSWPEVDGWLVDIKCFGVELGVVCPIESFTKVYDRQIRLSGASGQLTFFLPPTSRVVLERMVANILIWNEIGTDLHFLLHTLFEKAFRSFKGFLSILWIHALGFPI